MTAELVRPNVSGAHWGGFDLDRLRIAALARAVQTRLPYLHHCISSLEKMAPVIGGPLTFARRFASRQGAFGFSHARCSSLNGVRAICSDPQVRRSTALRIELRAASSFRAPMEGTLQLSGADDRPTVYFFCGRLRV